MFILSLIRIHSAVTEINGKKSQNGGICECGEEACYGHIVLRKVECHMTRMLGMSDRTNV